MNETWVTVTGWVGSVHCRDLASGGQVVTMRVASTPRRFQDGEWIDGTTAWHTVKVWRQLADNVAASVSKGDPVLVHGRLVAEEWTRQDGTTGVENVVVAAQVGHDLGRGRATFQRVVAPASESQEGSAQPPVEPAA